MGRAGIYEMKILGVLVAFPEEAERIWQGVQTRTQIDGKESG